MSAPALPRSECRGNKATHWCAAESLQRFADARTPPRDTTWRPGNSADKLCVVSRLSLSYASKTGLARTGLAPSRQQRRRPSMPVLHLWDRCHASLPSTDLPRGPRALQRPKLPVPQMKNHPHWPSRPPRTQSLIMQTPFFKRTSILMPSWRLSYSRRSRPSQRSDPSPQVATLPRASPAGHCARHIGMQPAIRDNVEDLRAHVLRLLPTCCPEGHAPLAVLVGQRRQVGAQRPVLMGQSAGNSPVSCVLCFGVTPRL
jgi:hypothetical protein